MWIALFIVIGIVVAILCVIAARQLSREEDLPTNLMTSEQIDAEDKKSSS